jgi:hypothetical protein
MSGARFLLAVSLGLTACDRAAAPGPALPAVTLTDERYKGLVFLVATVRSVGTQFHVTNESTQTWQDITFAIVGSDGSEYDLHIAEILAGQSATVDPSRFTGAQGLPFKPRQAMPRTFIITAEIGEGGPTGVYAVRL